MTSAQAEADERLRRRYPPPRLPRPALVMIVAVVAAGFLGWLVWAGLFHASPIVSGRVSAYAVLSDTQTTFTLTVQRPDPTVPAHCRVIAQATDFETVGSKTYDIPATDSGLVDLNETLNTFRRATSVSLDSCWR